MYIDNVQKPRIRFIIIEALALQLEIRGMAWLRELCSRKVEFLFFISKNSVFIC